MSWRAHGNLLSGILAVFQKDRSEIQIVQSSAQILVHIHLFVQFQDATLILELFRFFVFDVSVDALVGGISALKHLLVTLDVFFIVPVAADQCEITVHYICQ